VAQRVGRGIALLFHDCGTRRGWVVSSTPRLHFTPGKEPVPILLEAGWASGPVWMGRKSRPHRDLIPERPARSQSLYRLGYLAHIQFGKSGKISLSCYYVSNKHVRHILNVQHYEWNPCIHIMISHLKSSPTKQLTHNRHTYCNTIQFKRVQLDIFWLPNLLFLISNTHYSAPIFPCLLLSCVLGYHHLSDTSLPVNLLQTTQWRGYKPLIYQCCVLLYLDGDSACKKWTAMHTTFFQQQNYC